jgi:hypothetical protein
MSTRNTPPAPTAGASDDRCFREYGSGGLGVDAQREMIGGTHHVSTPVSPQQALTGGYTPIAGDRMPDGAPVDGSPPYDGPYLPNN